MPVHNLFPCVFLKGRNNILAVALILLYTHSNFIFPFLYFSVLSPFESELAEIVNQKAPSKCFPKAKSSFPSTRTPLFF